MKTLMRALVGAAAIAVAADKPDFSGTWKLDPDKSAFGPMPPPASMTLVIDHKDPAVSVNQSSTGPQGDQNTTSNYSTDGTETVNNFMGTEVRSKARWEDKTLVIESILDPGRRGGEADQQMEPLRRWHDADRRAEDLIPTGRVRDDLRAYEAVKSL